MWILQHYSIDGLLMCPSTLSAAYQREGHNHRIDKQGGVPNIRAQATGFEEI